MSSEEFRKGCPQNLCKSHSSALAPRRPYSLALFPLCLHEHCPYSHKAPALAAQTFTMHTSRVYLATCSNMYEPTTVPTVDGIYSRKYVQSPLSPNTKLNLSVSTVKSRQEKMRRQILALNFVIWERGLAKDLRE